MGKNTNALKDAIQEMLPEVTGTRGLQAYLQFIQLSNQQPGIQESVEHAVQVKLVDKVRILEDAIKASSMDRRINVAHPSVPMQKGRGLKGDALSTSVCLRGNNLKMPLTYVTGSIHSSSFAFSNCPRMYEAYAQAVLDNLHGFIQSQKRQISNVIESDATKKK